METTPFIKTLHERARTRGGHVVLPESEDPRVLKAAVRLVSEGICDVSLVGSASAIHQAAAQHHLLLPNAIRIAEPAHSSDTASFASQLFEKRKAKGLTEQQAHELVHQPLWFAASMLAAGQADACVAGAVLTTGEVLRAGLQVVGLKPGSSVVSGAFMMSWPDGRVHAYADCAVFPYPDSKQLAHIATDTSAMFSSLTGEASRTAFLSFATMGSASHERVDLVREAVEVARNAKPDLAMDGPLQFDAALIESIGQKKAPDSSVAGKANVFIFPNLDAGNIAYKVAERLGGAKATGPIIQGLARPFNDLSRGASSEDVFDTVCAALLMA